MKAKVYISYKDGILDPQGKTVQNALKNMGLKNILPWVKSKSTLYFK